MGQMCQTEPMFNRWILSLQLFIFSPHFIAYDIQIFCLFIRFCAFIISNFIDFLILVMLFPLVVCFWIYTVGRLFYNKSLHLVPFFLYQTVQNTVKKECKIILYENSRYFLRKRAPFTQILTHAHLVSQLISLCFQFSIIFPLLFVLLLSKQAHNKMKYLREIKYRLKSIEIAYIFWYLSTFKTKFPLLSIYFICRTYG